jgi:hypothetical protein
MTVQGIPLWRWEKVILAECAAGAGLTEHDGFPMMKVSRRGGKNLSPQGHRGAQRTIL